MIKKSILFITVLILFSCSKEKEQPVETSDTLIVGTFNLEWLGDGVRDRNDRSEKDYKKFAEIFTNLNADILAVQEVENPEALMKIIRFLPNYSFFVGKGAGQQNVGVVFKKSLKVDLLGEYDPLEVENRKTKPGLLISVKKKNIDFLFMAVHLKSSSHWDNTEEKQEASVSLRTAQAKIIAGWADSVLKNSKEKDLIIAGDFNDTPVRKKNNTLLPIINDKNLNMVTADMKSCRFKNAYGIDQIVLSVSASKRFQKGSERSYNFHDSMKKEDASKISDHCPVLINLDVSGADND